MATSLDKFYFFPPPPCMAPLLFLLFLPLTLAYTWSFQNTPQQCNNLTIAISGDDGKPPYRVLIIPFGPTPLPNAVEARKILDVGFADGAKSVSFVLKFPENSQFVAVVSSWSLSSIPFVCMFVFFSSSWMGCDLFSL